MVLVCTLEIVPVWTFPFLWAEPWLEQPPVLWDGHSVSAQRAAERCLWLVSPLDFNQANSDMSY